jgi:mannosyltransferase OCH1-like enzyme
MNKIIHQVYGVFNDGKSLNDIPIFAQQVSKTRQYCISNDIEYKMWDNDMCNELINKYPQYKSLYDNFREPVQKADFIRYLILYDEGGMYVDCDISPIGDIDDLFQMDEFFVIWDNDKKQLPYNAVLGSVAKTELYEDIFKEIIRSVKEKNKIDVYESWKGRYVFQTTGHFMLNRVLKDHLYVKRLNILKIYGKGGEIIGDVCPLFEDFNASTWYKNGNN